MGLGRGELLSRSLPLPKVSPYPLITSMAAAAGDKNDGKDDKPNPVVVEELAEAVVVHREPPK